LKNKLFLLIPALLLIFTSGAPCQQKTKIAVLALEGLNVPAADAAIVSDFLRVELYRTGKYTVLERENMDQVLSEQAFQQTGCTSQECAVQIGKLLNVEQVVMGIVSRLDNNYYLSVRMVDIKTSEIVFSNKEESGSAGNFSSMARQTALKMAGQKEPDTIAAPVPVAEPEPPKTAWQNSRFVPIKISIASGYDSAAVSLMDLSLVSAKSKKILGFQVSLACEAEEVYGFQEGIISGYAGKCYGFQSGFINKAGSCYGFQSGFINETGSLYGFQAGFINKAKVVYGFQAGFLNECEALKGFQVGVLNKVKRGFAPLLIGLNIGW